MCKFLDFTLNQFPDSRNSKSAYCKLISRKICSRNFGNLLSLIYVKNFVKATFLLKLKKCKITDFTKKSSERILRFSTLWINVFNAELLTNFRPLSRNIGLANSANFGLRPIGLHLKSSGFWAYQVSYKHYFLQFHAHVKTSHCCFKTSNLSLSE